MRPDDSIPSSLTKNAGQVIVVLSEAQAPLVLNGSSDPETSPTEAQAPFSRTKASTTSGPNSEAGRPQAKVATRYCTSPAITSAV